MKQRDFYTVGIVDHDEFYLSENAESVTFPKNEKGSIGINGLQKVSYTWYEVKRLGRYQV